MSARSGLKKAYEVMGGKVALASELNVSYQAVDKWYKRNEMPATEYNGKTMYSKKIQELTCGEVTIEDLCGFVPPPQSNGWKK